jgi:hypothetical protein
MEDSVHEDDRGKGAFHRDTDAGWGNWFPRHSTIKVVPAAVGGDLSRNALPTDCVCTVLTGGNEAALVT